MMRRIKAWTQLVCGGHCVLLGVISVANYAFDLTFIMPQSVVLAGVLVLGGGVLFANGLLAHDTQPKPSRGEDKQ